MYIDFQVLKDQVTILQVADILKLELKKEGEVFRTECPRCQNGKRTLVISPDKEAFFCFSANKGGDIISLVSHVTDFGVKDAAFFIHNSLHRSTEDGASKSEDKLEPLSYLEHTHDLVQQVGFSPEDAALLGLGYANKGLMRGRVAIPLRTTDGTLVGYIGITEGKLPKSLKLPQSNVVSFPKKESA